MIESVLAKHNAKLGTKITVKSLIEACHISRQTFYYHFQDIMDVLEWSVRQQTQQLVEKSRQAENLRAVLEIFISFTVDYYLSFALKKNVI